MRPAGCEDGMLADDRRLGTSRAGHARRRAKGCRSARHRAAPGIQPRLTRRLALQFRAALLLLAASDEKAHPRDPCVLSALRCTRARMIRSSASARGKRPIREPAAEVDAIASSPNRAASRRCRASSSVAGSSKRAPGNRPRESTAPAGRDQGAEASRPRAAAARQPRALGDRDVPRGGLRCGGSTDSTPTIVSADARARPLCHRAVAADAAIDKQCAVACGSGAEDARASTTRRGEAFAGRRLAAGGRLEIDRPDRVRVIRRRLRSDDGGDGGWRFAARRRGRSRGTSCRAQRPWMSPARHPHRVRLDPGALVHLQQRGVDLPFAERTSFRASPPNLRRLQGDPARHLPSTFDPRVGTSWEALLWRRRRQIRLGSCHRTSYIVHDPAAAPRTSCFGREPWPSRCASGPSRLHAPRTTRCGRARVRRAANTPTRCARDVGGAARGTPESSRFKLPSTARCGSMEEYSNEQTRDGLLAPLLGQRRGAFRLVGGRARRLPRRRPSPPAARRRAAVPAIQDAAPSASSPTAEAGGGERPRIKGFAHPTRATALATRP